MFPDSDNTSDDSFCEVFISALNLNSFSLGCLTVLVMMLVMMMMMRFMMLSLLPTGTATYRSSALARCI